ncbi:flippase-like domain-containing protein [Salinicola corii]|uniref:Flippase-like domain-containing protein n=1 Tax=Salinicola corii TaxID=2606937 RepID=A0A640WJJ0_9GAMM|nr:lysylphosphatidylglycerol synthase transmembrane domain-containing protein [Salinicola corii]KAA0020702.1 flippase-like domain-containing protein [Salinicola corii]
MNQWLSPWLRLAVTLALLGVLAWKLDTGQLLERFMALSPAWVMLAVLIGIPQVAISAWRWRMTAHRIGIALRWPTAIREYYLATFLNQVLPGGVLGDAARAWRHGNTRTQPGAGQPSPSGPAVRAVIIERASGQVALLLVAVAAICLSPALRHGIARAWHTQAMTLAWLPLAALLLAGITMGVLRRRRWPALATFGQDIRRTLLAISVWPAQLVSSLLVIATYVAVFLCAAQALGLQRPVPQLLPLIPPLLMAMAIPLTVAGWGLREGAAALIWPLAGLPAQEGVALSVTYGLLVLAASLPGLVVVLWDRRASRVASVRQKMASEGHPG